LPSVPVALKVTRSPIFAGEVDVTAGSSIGPELKYGELFPIVTLVVMVVMESA